MNFRSFRNNLNCSNRFKKELWSRLSRAWQESGLPPYVWYQTGYFRYAVMMVILLVVFSSFGTGAYAYSSPQVTEGTALFPFKQKLERLEEKIKRRPEDKAKFYLKQINRREAELVVIRKNFQLHVTSTQQRIEAIEKDLEKIGEYFKERQIKDSDLKERMEKRLEMVKNKRQNEVKLFISPIPSNTIKISPGKKIKNRPPMFESNKR